MDDKSNPDIDVLKIKAPSIPSSSPETLRAASKEEKALYSAHTEGVKQDIRERKKYARLIFWLCCSWVLAVYLLLLLQGFGSSFHFFGLSQPILLATIGSTTVNIIGVFLIVARYLFQDKG